MYVRDYMTANPFTISPEDTVADAMELLHSKKIKKIPVVKNDKLVGFVSERKLLEVSPSQATSLSIYEINHLLSKTKISTIMIKDVVTIESGSLIEEAALKLREYDVGGLPVVDDGKLVGIITEKDVFNAFMEIMGLHDKGTRISIAVNEDRPGVLAKLASIIAGFGLNILHLAVRTNEIVVRVNSLNIQVLLDALKAENFNVLSARSSEN